MRISEFSGKANKASFPTTVTYKHLEIMLYYIRDVFNRTRNIHVVSGLFDATSKLQ